MVSAHGQVAPVAVGITHPTDRGNIVNQEPCIVEDCERPRKYKSGSGYCGMHTERLRVHGSLEKPAPYVRGRAKPGWKPKHPVVCIADECERPAHLRGLCVVHYHRWRETGAVGGEIAPRVACKGTICRAAGCDREAKTRGWCKTHYERLWLTGDEPTGSIRPFNFAGNDVGYHGVHHRLTRWLGPARERPCRDCGMRAAHWSYNHGATDERIDTSNGLPYSVNPDDYDPRCVSCHARLDRGLVDYWLAAHE